MAVDSYRAEFTQRWDEVVADYIQNNIEVPVVDQTSLSGHYSGVFLRRLTTKPDDSPESMREQIRENVIVGVGSLGLKLEPDKLPVEILVIDHVDRAPSEN